MAENHQTIKSWWITTRDNPESLNKWLIDYYLAELALTIILFNVIIKYSYKMDHALNSKVYKLFLQACQHESWFRTLLDARKITIPVLKKPLKAFSNIYHVKNNNSIKLQIIAKDLRVVPDIRKTFINLIPHENWQESIFTEIKDELISVIKNNKPRNNLI